jgi:hypothetical protein
MTVLGTSEIGTDSVGDTSVDRVSGQQNLIEQAESRTNIPLYLVKLELPNLADPTNTDILYFSTSKEKVETTDPTTGDEVDWKGKNGSLKGIGTIKETARLRANGTKLEFIADPNDPDQMTTRFLQSQWQESNATIWFTFKDPTKNEPIQPLVRVFDGFLDSGRIDESTGDKKITFNLESSLRDMLRPSTRWYTNEDQKEEFPNDRFFEFIAGMRKRKITWGRQPIPIEDEPVPRSLIYGTTRTRGHVMFAETQNDGCRLWAVMAIAGHSCAEIPDVYFNEELVQLNADGTGAGKWENDLKINFHLGADDQTADSDLVSASSKWTTEHRGRGVTYAVLRLDQNVDLYPTGFPRVEFVVKGKDDIYDPRDGLFKFTNNWGLVTADYLTSDLGARVDREAVSDAQTGRAANISDEGVDTLTGTEKRYTINGKIKSSSEPKTILSKLRQSAIGDITYSGGRFFIIPGKDTASVKVFDDDDLESDIEWEPKKGRDRRFNIVTGKFQFPQADYTLEPFPAVTKAEFQTEDNDKEIEQQVNFPFTTSSPAAQRKALALIRKVRQQGSGRLTYKGFNALQLRPSSIIEQRHVQGGFNWDTKKLRVVEWRLLPGPDPINIQLVVEEWDSSVFDWDPEFDQTLQTDPVGLNLSEATDIQVFETEADIPASTCRGVIYASEDGAFVVGNGGTGQRIDNQRIKQTALRVELRTDDPADPPTGYIWLRTDL